MIQFYLLLLSVAYIAASVANLKMANAQGVLKTKRPAGVKFAVVICKTITKVAPIAKLLVLTNVKISTILLANYLVLFLIPTEMLAFN